MFFNVFFKSEKTCFYVFYLKINVFDIYGLSVKMHTDRNLGVGGHPDPFVGIHRSSSAAAVSVEGRRRPSSMVAPSNSSWDDLVNLVGVIRGRDVCLDATVRVQDPRRQHPGDGTPVDNDQ